MAVQTVIRMGHPTLRLIAKPYPVDDIGSSAFLRLIQNMRETLHAQGGIGLAAPQIDVSTQVAVIEIENTSTRYGELDRIPFSVFVNPVISVADGEIAGYWEGCLSVPGLMGYVERYQHVQIDYLDEAGTAQSVEYQGFIATVIQHELDHLQGKLYVDRMKDPTQFAFDEEYQAYHVDESKEIS
ncbi:MAG: peptide deformylase [Proteobacteria bacterium]|nr:peptide deformylase [Pseudomonadota bacterium]